MNQARRKDMRAYEFYLRDKEKDHLIGILPERRKDQQRVNQETILNWGKKILGDNPDIDLKTLFFIQVEV